MFDKLIDRRTFARKFALTGLGCLTSGAFLNSNLGVDARVWGEETTSDGARKIRLKYLSRYERGKECFTQGLCFEADPDVKEGVLYESGGRYGTSLLRKVEAGSGKVIRSIKLPDRYFGEGLAIVGDRLYMLTWREKTCFVFDKNTFKQVDEFRYRGEGWGLAYDGKSLAMSDGSDKIRFINPENFRVQKVINVYYRNSAGVKKSLRYLNELEYVDGELWANVFQEKYVVRIDPNTGEILGNILNMESLVPKDLATSDEYVLNGVAYDAATRRLFITGKCWPVVYVFTIGDQTDAEEAASI